VKGMIEGTDLVDRSAPADPIRVMGGICEDRAPQVSHTQVALANVNPPPG